MPATNPPAPAGDEARRSTKGACWWDATTVVDSLGEPTILLGHSYGALCALEAPLLTTNVPKLLLYEPGIEVAGEEISPQEVIERLEALLEVGDREGVVVTFMREVAGLLTETVEHMRSQPAWQALVAAAHTIPRELRAGKAGQGLQL